MITALRYALYLPHSRDFIRGESDRSLAKLIRSRDVCHVVEQASRIVDGELQRIVVGMVADWPDGGTQDLDNPSRLQRVFYGWLTGSGGPTIDDLGFRTTAGRWATRMQFVDSVRLVLPHGGAAPPHQPSNRQGDWSRWLAAAGVDLDQIRFQAVMNASEGGVDRVMRFTDSDDFVRWLIGATMPTSTVDQITNSIDQLRTNAAARPQWEHELHLWQQIIDPLLGLAIANERVGTARRASATAEANAATIVADAVATLAALEEQRLTAKDLFDHHEQARKDAVTAARRAQAHRLRMQLRAAELRVQESEEIAASLLEERDTAADELAAWRIVGEVQQARQLSGTLVRLEAQRDAAEQETQQLRNLENRYRRELARLLTHYRDTATDAVKVARAALKTAEEKLTAADEDLQTAIAGHAHADAQLSRFDSDLQAAEQTIVDAVEAGLLTEGAEPAQRDAELIEHIGAARRANADARKELGRIGGKDREIQQALSSAEQQISTARSDIDRFERELRAVGARMDALINDERLQNGIGRVVVDPWLERTSLTDALRTAAQVADGDAVAAREAADAAQRAIDSINADGLLPPSTVVMTAADRCTTQDLPAWPGWRWLADTMTAQEAAAFAEARPEIASGVVVAHRDLVEHAVTAIDGMKLDVALWVGAVDDPLAAKNGPREPSATTARVILPTPGLYDRDTAAQLVNTARRDRATAERGVGESTRRGEDARAVLARLEQLWADLPDDPRGRLRDAVESAHIRRQEAEVDERDAQQQLADLEAHQQSQQEILDTTQQTIDDGVDIRRRLAPAILAAGTARGARAQMPVVREAVSDLDQRIRQLRVDRPGLGRLVTEATRLVDERIRAAEDATEALRLANLAPTTDGPIPSDDDETLRQRLAGVEAAIEDKTVDPALHDQIRETREQLSDVEAGIGSDHERRMLAEQFASGDGARHPVALSESVRSAQDREAHARGEHGRAEAAADAARNDHQRRAEDRTDRSSPDAEGFPAAALVGAPAEADRYARQLDEIAQQRLEERSTEERWANGAQQTAQRAETSAKLVEASAKQLRYLAVQTVVGRPASDIDALIGSLARIADEQRQAQQALSDGQENLRTASDTVRAHANSTDSRLVEDRKDPRVGDLIRRLRADQELPSDAERLAGQLEQRVATLRDDLANHDKHVRTSAEMLHIQAATAVEKLRHYQNQSRLPTGLGEWSDQRFVVVDHEAVPTDESVAVDRVSRVVHSLLAPGAGHSDAETMLFAATRALVDAPFRVRLLKPHTDLALDRVDVAQLKNFSGGQRVTAGVLMYATMARVRAAGDATSIGWLWLDNPFGQASADQFVRTMRLAADKLGLQLVFTAAPKDKGALSMFDRTITLARRSRPSSGEKVIVVDDGKREIADLTLMQNDVLEVLGE